MDLGVSNLKFENLDVDDLSQWALCFPKSKIADFYNTQNISKDLLMHGSASLDGIACRRCKTPNPLIWQRQTRSADESMTVFFLCKNPTCGNRWRE